MSNNYIEQKIEVTKALTRFNFSLNRNNYESHLKTLNDRFLFTLLGHVMKGLITKMKDNHEGSEENDRKDHRESSSFHTLSGEKEDEFI